MSDNQLLDAAIKLNVSINRALEQPNIPIEEVVKLMAAAVNILLYDRIEKWTQGLAATPLEKKVENSS